MRARKFPLCNTIFRTSLRSVASMAPIVVSAILALAGFAMGQTITYKTLKRIEPGTGTRSSGSPVDSLTDARWSDGSHGGGYVKPDPNYKPPRTPDGQPDIQGIWSVTSTLLGRDYRYNGVVDPPDGKIPYQPWAGKKAADLADHYIASTTTCQPTGVPRHLAYLDFQLIQAPGEVLAISEHLTNFRHIPVDGRPHLASDMKLWMGDSRGHWEGNTLVIDVTNQNDRSGSFHTDRLHVTERLMPIDADTLQYEATIEDPDVYEKPWKIAFPLLRTPRYELLEENCGEGNKDLDLQLEVGLKIYTGPEDLR